MKWFSGMVPYQANTCCTISNNKTSYHAFVQIFNTYHDTVCSTSSDKNSYHYQTMIYHIWSYYITPTTEDVLAWHVMITTPHHIVFKPGLTIWYCTGVRSHQTNIYHIVFVNTHHLISDQVVLYSCFQIIWFHIMSVFLIWYH